MGERKPDKRSRLTEEEQRLKERLSRKEPQPGELSRGSGKVPERSRKIPKTDEERRALIRQIARSGKPEDIRPGRSVPKEFWKLPRPKDPEGLLLKALLDDREQGR